MQKLLYVLVIICFPLISFCQYEIKGIVVNAKTGAPIENVNLQVRNSTKGTSTDKDGEYRLAIIAFPVIIEITCIGYEPGSIEISGEVPIPLEIAMQPALQLLEGVTITADKVIPVYQNSSYSVIDYEILGDDVLLLVYKNQLKQSVIVVLTRSGDTLSQAFPPEMPPDKLYKDVLGNVHYFTKKGNAYQCHLDRTKKSLTFPYCFSSDTLLRTFGSFRFLMNKRFFFEESGPEGFSTLLGYYEKETGKKYLQAVGDMALAKNYYNDLDYYMRPRRTNENSMSMAGFNMRAFELFYKPKSIASIQKIGADRIAVFDFTTDSMQIRDPDWKLITASHFSFHKEKKENALTTVAKAYSGNKWKWRWTMLSDEYSGKVYTIFEKYGRQKLCNINTQTGEIAAEYEIPVLFAEKITVYKGEAYFLFKPIGENEKWRLYKMRL